MIWCRSKSKHGSSEFKCGFIRGLLGLGWGTHSLRALLELSVQQKPPQEGKSDTGVTDSCEKKRETGRAGVCVYHTGPARPELCPALVNVAAWFSAKKMPRQLAAAPMAYKHKHVWVVTQSQHVCLPVCSRVERMLTSWVSHCITKWSNLWVNTEMMCCWISCCCGMQGRIGNKNIEWIKFQFRNSLRNLSFDFGSWHSDEIGTTLKTNSKVRTSSQLALLSIKTGKWKSCVSIQRPWVRTIASLRRN